MAQLLTSHSAFEEDLSSFPVTYIDGSPWSVTPVPTGGSDTSGLLRPLHTCACPDTHVHILTHTLLHTTYSGIILPSEAWRRQPMGQEEGPSSILACHGAQQM